MPRGTSRYDEARLQGRLWTPELLRGQAALVAWFDALDLTKFTLTSTGFVTQWSDKSGFARHATRSGADTNKPAFGRTANAPGVTFTGANNLLLVTLPNFPLDFALAGTPTAGTGAFRRILSASNGNGPARHDSTTGIGASGGSGFTFAGSLAWVGAGVAYYSFPSTASGTAGINGSVQTAIGANTFTQPWVGIGNNFSVGSQGFGSMNEMVITTNLSQMNRQKVEGYLAWKWAALGLVDFMTNLAASHPFKNRPPMIGD